MTYKSALGDWHERASVRSKPRRCLSQNSGNDGLLWFPAELAPFVSHPLVSAADPKLPAEGLLQQLFSYLVFTDRLEHEVVNRTARRLAAGPSGLVLPSLARMDAHKICCDEAYHALFSADLMFQIEAETGFEYRGGTGHPALDAFFSEVDAFEPQDRGWLELFMVVVSETLISGSLLRIPEAKDVVPAVRELVADHAVDEVRHHAFFTRLCRIAWPQMPRRLQVQTGRILPGFIRQFLTPDFPALRAFLGQHFSQDQVETILRESYPPDLLLRQAQAASRATIRAFQQAGALEIPEVADAFAAEGFQLASSAATA